jgi:hypothetical protein
LNALSEEPPMSNSNKPIDLDQVVGWPHEAHKLAPVAHVHAFGMIALWSTMMEESLSILLVHFLPIKKDIAISLIHKLAIREKSDLLRQLVTTNESEHVGIIDMLVFAINCFEICNENRNILVHAIYESTDQATSIISLKKRAHNNPLNVLKLEYSLPTLRLCAEEIANTVNFMLDLFVVLTRGPSNTLIRKPPQPNRLTPS